LSEPRSRRIARAVERWFARHQRPLPWRAGYDPYAVWVSEVMAQQTRIEVVLNYFQRFLERFPDVSSLASATDDEVTAQWSGLGYYRRARMMRAGAIDVMQRFGGKVPRTADELMSIAGIGRYTAGAIASIAHGERVPAVDGNIERITSRLFGGGDPWKHAASIVEACRSPRDCNQGLMEIGALICRPRNPLCTECPLSTGCVAFAEGRVAELPERKERPSTRTMRVTLYLVTDRRGRILMRREAGPLMRGLYHLPHADTSLLTGTPLEIASSDEIGRFRHTITTRRIEFALHAARLPAPARKPPGDEYSWVAPGELSSVPHPSYLAKALRLPRNRRGL
jgi:A/G-specific adenine glycosylase